MQVLKQQWIPWIVAVMTGIPCLAEAQILNGVGSGDQFGWSVASAGDVNKDGIDDLLVGAPHGDQGGGDAGEVYLFLGLQNGFPSEPDLVILGESGGDEFGFAVSGAGDVNNDGYDDFLVGAPGRDTNGASSGRAYLFLGGSSPNGTADKSWDGDLPQARFGAAVAGGFNFNNDSRSDFAVGAPDNNGTGAKAGQVKIYLGASSGLAAETYVLEGDQANWALGRSISPAGDLNKDGFDDLVAGAPQPYDFNSGRAVVWFGQSSSSSPPERLVLSGETGTDQFGWDVSGAGDLNGDGADDLLVGAPHRGADNGAVYLFRGGTTMDADYDWRSSSGAGGDLLGMTVEGGYDLNRDGKPDFAAGAPGANSLASDAGEVLIFFGKTTPSSGGDSLWVPQAPVSSFEAGDEFGSSLALLGSFDGKEGAELAAGAPYGNISSGSAAGYVNLLTYPGGDTPVQLLALEAGQIASGVELRWQLTDAVGVAGFRVEVEEAGAVRALHVGWLPYTARSFVDDQSTRSERVYRLLALDRTGAISTLGSVRFVAGTQVLGLAALDANPFREEVRLRLATPGGFVQAFVSDVQGREVRKLLEGTFAPGAQLLTWDGRDARGMAVPPGMYIVWSRAGGQTTSLKVVRQP